MSVYTVGTTYKQSTVGNYLDFRKEKTSSTEIHINNLDEILIHAIRGMLRPLHPERACIVLLDLTLVNNLHLRKILYGTIPIKRIDNTRKIVSKC